MSNGGEPPFSLFAVSTLFFPSVHPYSSLRPYFACHPLCPSSLFPAPFLRPNNLFLRPSLSHSSAFILPFISLYRFPSSLSLVLPSSRVIVLSHSVSLSLPLFGSGSAVSVWCATRLRSFFFPLSIHLLVSRRVFEGSALSFVFRAGLSTRRKRPRWSPRRHRIARGGCVECRITSGRGAINARIMFNIVGYLASPRCTATTFSRVSSFPFFLSLSLFLPTPVPRISRASNLPWDEISRLKLVGNRVICLALVASMVASITT